jgi:hypothetical protein
VKQRQWVIIFVAAILGIAAVVYFTREMQCGLWKLRKADDVVPGDLKLGDFDACRDVDCPLTFFLSPEGERTANGRGGYSGLRFALGRAAVDVVRLEITWAAAYGKSGKGL